MAVIPDNAIDRMYDELTSGARDLYTFLCRCRNQVSGKCCPSVSTTQDALKLSRARVFALRKELAAKGWAEFNGNYAVQLFGFNSLKNKTIHELGKEDNGNDADSLKNKTLSLENETGEIEETDAPSLEIETDNVAVGEVIEFPTVSLKNKTEDPESLENETAANGESLENKTESLKNKTKKSQKQDLHVRKNQQRNQQRRTSKESSAVAPAGSLTRQECFSLFCQLRGTLGGYEAPYQDRDADFVQLAALYKNCTKTNWALTAERFTQAAAHYFETPRSAHTLADLAANFSEFFKQPLDRFGKPVDQNGNGGNFNGKAEISKNGKYGADQSGAHRTTDDYGIKDCPQL